jgi:plastocyanin
MQIIDVPVDRSLCDSAALTVRTTHNAQRTTHRMMSLEAKRRTPMRIVRNGFIGAAILILGAGGATQLAGHTFAATHVGASTTVKVVTLSGKYAFNPTGVTISKGTKVVWKNTTNSPHTITSNKTKSGKPVFDKALARGTSLNITFSSAGTYNYHCAIHPYMKGKITIK